MRTRPAVLVLAVGGLLGVGALPAAAAGNSISPGDSLYALSCYDLAQDYQLFSVESSTGVSAMIGGGPDTELPTCSGQPAYDPSTGASYYIQWADEENAALGRIDVATGVSTTIGGFYWDNGEFPEYVPATSMAIGGDGSAFLISGEELYSLDLATAFVEPVASLAEANLYSFAWDSVTDSFYVINTSWDLFELDVTDGTLTFIDTIGFTGAGLFGTYSLQFDKAGTLWIELDVNSALWEGGMSTLWSATFATLDAPVLSGIFTDDPFYTEALLIVPGQPKLAATGSDTAAVLPWALGAGALLAAAGVGLALHARRRTA